MSLLLLCQGRQLSCSKGRPRRKHGWRQERRTGILKQKLTFCISKLHRQCRPPNMMIKSRMLLCPSSPSCFLPASSFLSELSSLKGLRMSQFILTHADLRLAIGCQALHSTGENPISSSTGKIDRIHLIWWLFEGKGRKQVYLSSSGTSP